MPGVRHPALVDSELLSPAVAAQRIALSRCRPLIKRYFAAFASRPLFIEVIHTNFFGYDQPLTLVQPLEVLIILPWILMVDCPGDLPFRGSPPRLSYSDLEQAGTVLAQIASLGHRGSAGN